MSQQLSPTVQRKIRKWTRRRLAARRAQHELNGEHKALQTYVRDDNMGTQKAGDSGLEGMLQKRVFTAADQAELNVQQDTEQQRQEEFDQDTQLAGEVLNQLSVAFLGATTGAVGFWAFGHKMLQNERTRRLLIKGMGMAVCGICRLPDVLGKETAEVINEGYKVHAETQKEYENKVKELEENKDDNEQYEKELEQTLAHIQDNRERAMDLLAFALRQLEHKEAGSRHNVAMQSLIRGLNAAGFLKQEDFMQATVSPAVYLCTAMSTMRKLQQILGTLMSNEELKSASPRELELMVPTLTQQVQELKVCSPEELTTLKEEMAREAKLTLQLGISGIFLGGQKLPDPSKASTEDFLKFRRELLAHNRTAEGTRPKPNYERIDELNFEEIQDHINTVQGEWIRPGGMSSEEFNQILIRAGVESTAMELGQDD